MDIDILEIDQAKRVFQVHGADRRGQALHSSKVLRAELLSSTRAAPSSAASCWC